MKIRAIVLCVTASFLSGCAWFNFGDSAKDAVPVTVTSTDQAVEQFLAGRELEAIEGAWEHDENAFEMVIARNDFSVAPAYDFVGFITRSDQPSWDEGDIKVLLRRTDTAGVFEGVWMTRNKSRKVMTFVVENRNLVQASFIGNDGNAYFVRIRRINPRLAAAH